MPANLKVQGHIELTKEAAQAPANPGNDRARIYIEDSGGKTRLMVKFGTGAAQQIAIEP